MDVTKLPSPLRELYETVEEAIALNDGHVPSNIGDIIDHKCDEVKMTLSENQARDRDAHVDGIIDVQQRLCTSDDPHRDVASRMLVERLSSFKLEQRFELTDVQSFVAWLKSLLCN